MFAMFCSCPPHVHHTLLRRLIHRSRRCDDKCGAGAKRQRLSTPSHRTRSANASSAGPRAALPGSGGDRIVLHPARCVLCTAGWGAAKQHHIELSAWRCLVGHLAQLSGEVADTCPVCSRAGKGMMSRSPTRALMLLNVLSR